MRTATEASRLDRFLPVADIRERHEILVDAPAALVMDAARRCDMRSLGPVAAILRLRALLLGSRQNEGPREGLVDETRRLGWGVLEEDEGRYYCAGAVCQPWLADVVFASVPPAEFAGYGEPDRVKIAWTLEVEPLGPERTRLATETRAAATDERARRKFRRYWMFVSPGIVLIRRCLLRAVRRAAERAWRGSGGASSILIRLHHSATATPRTDSDA